MKLDELKAKNKEEEDKEVNKPEDQKTEDDKVDEDLDLDTEDDDDESDDSDDDSSDDLEPWQRTDDQTSDKMPVETHIKVKKKLKGRLAEKDEELERLRAENESLKKAKPETKQDEPVLPKSEDFGTDEEYQKALADYHDKRADMRFTASQKKREQSDKLKVQQVAREKAVDGHYDRAAKLVEESGIDPELFKQTDVAVRSAVESILPGRGDLITDQIISVMGEGSEKVLYFLGRNKTAMSEMKNLLAEDSTGMRLSIYLGQQKERLTNPKKRSSKAPAPASNIKGDNNSKVKGSAEKKKYDKAHKNRNNQLAYNIKKEAKKAGIDVSGW